MTFSGERLLGRSRDEHSTGGAFASETDLAAPVERWLLAEGASCVAHEVEAGFGVPDLVAGVGDPARLRNRRRQAPPVVDGLQLRLLQFCQRWRTENDLRDWAPTGYSRLRKRAVLPLLELGLLRLLEGRLRARSDPKDPFTALVAVELKLADVGRGLRQAHSYRTFADATYLAVPAQRVTGAVMEQARRHAVGLLAVHPATAEAVVTPPAGSLAAPGRRRLASERVLSALADVDRRSGGSARR